MRARPPMLAALAALVLGSCSASAASDKGPQIDAQPGTSGASRTVDVGSTRPGSTSTSTTTTLPAEPVITDDRVFLVGDSITESISSRYSGAVCDALNPLGWDVTVDAVMGRQTSDAVQSLRTHLSDVGQVMVVLIGHNDAIDPTSYRTQLERLFALVPDVRRIYLLTNYQFEKGRDRMNAVLEEEAASDGTSGPDDRIELVDWNTVVEGVKGAIRSDGLHLTSIGQEALAGTIASALGLAPGATPPTTTTTIAGDSTTAAKRSSSSSRSSSANRCRTEKATTTSGSSGSNRGSGGSGSGGGRTTTTSPGSGPTTSPGTEPSGTGAPPSSKPGKPGSSTTAPSGTNPPGTTAPHGTAPQGTSPPGT